MTLVYILILLMAGGIAAGFASKIDVKLPRWISAITIVTATLMLLPLAMQCSCYESTAPFGWLMTFQHPWISLAGIGFNLGIDGLSLIMLFVSLFMSGIALIISWNKTEKPGMFHFCFLWMLAGIAGIFLATDLFLFYFFWEVMLIPLFFLILIFGKEKSNRVAIKFLIYTQASGLLMLLSIIGLYYIHGSATRIYTFEYTELLGTAMSPHLGILLLSGFLIAFFVKLPVVPFHGWLPDAFSTAPIAACLTGLLIKTGAYGILRFAIPLFPDAAMQLTPLLMGMGVISVFYGAITAFSQTNVNKIAAYSAISHMGFILIGCFAFSSMAYQGVVIQMIASALSTGALLFIAYSIYTRTNTYEIENMGGFWSNAPILSGFGLAFAMATLGLPGMGNFVAEFLILAGSFIKSPLLVSLAAIGLIIGVIYALRLVQKIFKGPATLSFIDFNIKEKILASVLIVVIIFIGVYPKPIINKTKRSIYKIIEYTKPENRQQPTIIVVPNEANV